MPLKSLCSFPEILSTIKPVRIHFFLSSSSSSTLFRLCCMACIYCFMVCVYFYFEFLSYVYCIKATACVHFVPMRPWTVIMIVNSCEICILYGEGDISSSTDYYYYYNYEHRKITINAHEVSVLGIRRRVFYHEACCNHC